MINTKQKNAQTQKDLQENHATTMLRWCHGGQKLRLCDYDVTLVSRWPKVAKNYVCVSAQSYRDKKIVLRNHFTMRTGLKQDGEFIITKLHFIAQNARPNWLKTMCPGCRRPFETHKRMCYFTHNTLKWIYSSNLIECMRFFFWMENNCFFSHIF